MSNRLNMTPDPKPPASSPCTTCLDMDRDEIKKESTKIRGYSPGLQEISNSAKTCTSCKIVCQAIEHCYPEVWEAASYYRAFFFLFEVGLYSNGLETFGLSVSPKKFPDTEEDPLEKIKDGWKRRLLHIFSVPGSICVSFLLR
jgi:hypothetical protein